MSPMLPRADSSLKGTRTPRNKPPSRFQEVKREKVICTPVSGSLVGLSRQTSAVACGGCSRADGPWSQTRPRALQREGRWSFCHYCIAWGLERETSSADEKERWS